jgi:hypothetical protein
MSVFLVLVASSTLFFSSPAVAATSSVTLLTEDNFQTEVLKSDKPVVVISAYEPTLEQGGTSLEKLKSEAESYFGDKYKVVVGKAENSPFPVITTRTYPPSAGITGFKNGKQEAFGIFYPRTSNTQAFENIKGQLEG